MPLINLPEIPGILAALDMRPDFAAPLRDMTNVMLLGPEGSIPEPGFSRLGNPTISRAERELIGAFVSRRNKCKFCSTSHAAIASHLYGNNSGFVEEVLCNSEHPDLSEKMRALLAIAAKVQADATKTEQADVDRALSAGATQADIYDTVVITAIFAMYNRIVDGLKVNLPEVESYYDEIGPRVAQFGYRSVSSDMPAPLTVNPSH